MDVKELIQTTVDKLSDIANILYKGSTNEGIAMMTEVIDNLGIIATNISDENMQISFLNEGLVPALGAMENNDGTLLADIITYEIIELLNKLV